MKLKTSVTLSEDVLEDIDRNAKKHHESRSEAIERLVMRAFLEEDRAGRNARDLEQINKHSKELNREAKDVLEYQEEP